MHLICLTDNFFIIWLVLLTAKFLAVQISSLYYPLFFLLLFRESIPNVTGNP
jgi:hypothetical protein